jgi:NADH-quinone oxidoreductase subunit I
MSLLKDIWNAVSGIGKGMTKTYDEQFDPVFTEMYPFELPKLPPVSVQSLALIKNEDGSDRCVSCLACEKVCPSQVITIERKKNPAGKGFVLERFDIDLVNCMYCAACVESCPASAIVTIQDFEMSTPNLQTLKADKDFLDFQGLRAQQWYSPKIGVEYRENVSETNIHGQIVKAPLEEQPGGLAEMEKLRESGAELPASTARAPKLAMSELPAAAIYAQLEHEPIKPSAPQLEAPAPVIETPSSAAASTTVITAAPASSAPATTESGAPRSKKIKRWGEPKADDSSAEPAPAAVTPAPAAEAPKETAPEASSQAAAPSSDAAPAADAPASDAKPRSSKIKRWEPKN